MVKTGILLPFKQYLFSVTRNIITFVKQMKR